MPRELGESLKDLQDTVFHIEKTAAHLFNIIRHDEGGDEIKYLRIELLAFMDTCENVQATWEAEGD